MHSGCISISHLLIVPLSLLCPLRNLNNADCMARFVHGVCVNSYLVPVLGVGMYTAQVVFFEVLHVDPSVYMARWS
ncbi:hypothetical protein OUZ56_017198 [Daphnia magna]|uniref:Uncharacterized protein n=1 Tax=Daphnia magna TaxID=35525 RepID=A0ABR0ASD9_9CRUS|nr:hypothetical protein OUZ56_017198 [Daphnia magna]